MSERAVATVRPEEAGDEAEICGHLPRYPEYEGDSPCRETIDAVDLVSGEGQA